MERKAITKFKVKENQETQFNELVSEAPKKFTKICCPSCDNEISAADININDKIAKCGSCNVLFSIENEVSKLASEIVGDEVLRPKGVDVKHFEDGLELSINQPVSVIEAIAMVFIPFIAFISTIIYIKKGIPVLIPLGLWSAFAFNIFNLIKRERHKIFFRVDESDLSVFWMPNKLMKDKKIKVSEIDQIYIRKSTSGGSGIYAIVNDASGQEHVPLIKGLTRVAQGTFIVQELEKALNIEDRRVSEENL